MPSGRHNEAANTSPFEGEVLLDRFEMQEMLGEGGMASVWSAHDRVLDRTVAVKRITAGVLSESDLIRFQREAKAASTVDHANVIQMLDFGMADAKPYMVMEFVEGITLFDLIHTQGAQDRFFALEIVAQTLDGIAAVHKAGIVHRDLKAGNVMVLSKNIEDRQAPHDDIHVKILDFGIAKSLDSKSQGSTLTKKGLIVGTPRYMSPEQAQAQGLDQRSDLYSIGCIAYELLTGFPVFSGDTAIETIAMHIDAERPTLKLKRPDVDFPVELEELIAKALSKRPSHRFQSASEMALEVRKIQENLSVPLFDDEEQNRDKNPELNIRMKEQQKTGRIATFVYAGVAALILAIVGLSAKSIVEIVAQKTKPMEKQPTMLPCKILAHLPETLGGAAEFMSDSEYFLASGNNVDKRLKELALTDKHPTSFHLRKVNVTEELIKEIVEYHPKTIELWKCTGITAGVVDLIAGCSSVDSLDFDESEMSPAILGRLKPSKCVKLSLRACDLSDEHLKAIANMPIQELNATENKNLNLHSLEILKRSPQRLRLKIWINGWSVPALSTSQLEKLANRLGMFITTKPFVVTTEWLDQLEE